MIGLLDDSALLAEAVRDADGVVNAASADHRGAVAAMLAAMVGPNKLLLHISGSSIVGNRAGGGPTDDMYDETTPLRPSPARAARVALNEDILAVAEIGVRAVII
ncbi:MAG: hypothetical protein HC869_07190 [Rhodospirillales bacterium]|nr:hypothetical protein [Rhodospirillales bacterium]